MEKTFVFSHFSTKTPTLYDPKTPQNEDATERDQGASGWMDIDRMARGEK